MEHVIGFENQQEQLELDFDIDVEEDKEELQMPELSKGKYIHDFKVRLLWYIGRFFFN